jgi:hypothetical protein
MCCSRTTTIRFRIAGTGISFSRAGCALESGISQACETLRQLLLCLRSQIATSTAQEPSLSLLGAHSRGADPRDCGVADSIAPTEREATIAYVARCTRRLA